MKAKAAPDQKPLVIVVDDSVSILNSTKRLIRSFGFRPESFASANEFFGSKLINECACLILDVRMPCVDGLELQRRLAETHPHIPIVFFTAHGSNEEQERAMTAGAVAFLRKPVTSEVLFHAIQNALRQNHRKSNEG
jgi:two-component system response regulator FixJ